MDVFHRFAVFTVARDATFVALAAVCLMIGFSFAPALALSIGANIALLFAFGLLLRAACLSLGDIVDTEVWRVLKPEERPPDEAARRQARDDLQEVQLRFAKNAAAVAIALYCSSLLLSLNKASRSLQAVVRQQLG